MPSRAIYLCPICEQELTPIGFCHLICPSGHYQEVCSDLFLPDRIDADQAQRILRAAVVRPLSKDSSPHES